MKKIMMTFYIVVRRNLIFIKFSKIFLKVKKNNFSFHFSKSIMIYINYLRIIFIIKPFMKIAKVIQFLRIFILSSKNKNLLK
jgi:hypothetical protein